MSHTTHQKRDVEKLNRELKVIADSVNTKRVYRWYGREFDNCKFWILGAKWFFEEKNHKFENFMLLREVNISVNTQGNELTISFSGKIITTDKILKKRGEVLIMLAISEEYTDSKVVSHTKEIIHDITTNIPGKSHAKDFLTLIDGLEDLEYLYE